MIAKPITAGSVLHEIKKGAPQGAPFFYGCFRQMHLPGDENLLLPLTLSQIF